MKNYGSQYEQVLPVLQSKCEEFHYQDYNTSTPENLWQYCVKKKWRKKDIGEMRLYEMVNEIMEMTASEFVAFHQMEGLKGDNWFSDMKQEDLNMLLRPSRKGTTSI